MKIRNKILAAIGVVAFAVAMAFNINASLNSNSEMNFTLANVEALARGELGEVSEVYCSFSGSPWGQCYYLGETGEGGSVFICRDGGSECSGTFITR